MGSCSACCVKHLPAVLQAVAAAACSTLRMLVMQVPADPAWEGS